MTPASPDALVGEVWRACQGNGGRSLLGRHWPRL